MKETQMSNNSIGQGRKYEPIEITLGSSSKEGLIYEREWSGLNMAHFSTTSLQSSLEKKYIS